MKFTIGTISCDSSFEKDMSLIKRSVLYADEIELIGMAEYAFFKYLPSIIYGDHNLEVLLQKLLTFVRSLNVPHMPDKESTIIKLEAMLNLLGQYSPKLKKKKRRTPEEFRAQLKVNQIRKDFKKELDGVYQRFLDTPYSLELQGLIQEGIVRVFDYQFQGINTYELAGGYFGSLLNTFLQIIHTHYLMMKVWM